MADKGKPVAVQALKPSTMEEITKRAEAQLVEISDFYGEEQPLIFKLKHASLIALAMGGGIPNELISTVSGMYKSGLSAEVDLKKRGEVLEQIAKAVMVEPSYDEIKAAGIQLTDRQLSEMYVFMMNGVRALKAFRGIE